MSIINDALKKVRRQESLSSPPSDASDTFAPLPKRRNQDSHSHHKLLFPVAILVLVFLGLLSGLGYFIYKEYFTEEAAQLQSTEEVTTGEVFPQNDKVATPSDRPSLPVSPTVTPPLQPPITPSPQSPSFNPVVFLEELQLNGVMRGGETSRILTQTGVYREGDLLKTPEGFRLIQIGERTLTVQSPNEEKFEVPIP